jgi:uncharacterized repeat protein (TIGR03806 family)
MKSLNHSIIALLFGTTITGFMSCSKEDFQEENIAIPATEQFSPNLSNYNIYQGEAKDLVPSSDFHLLELGAALFSNYAKKQRLIKLPEGAEMVANGNGIPDFPDGTILVKTFYYFNDFRDETLGKKIMETRLLIKNSGQWNAASYVWNENQTDAIYVPDGINTTANWIDLSGDPNSIAYTVPDQNDCVSCHQSNSEVLPIGPSMRNLNINVSHENTQMNQLSYLQSIGILNNFDVNDVTTLPNYNDPNISLSDRGKSYIDMNCAHCHKPSGWSRPAREGYDFRFETALNQSNISGNEDRIKRVVQNGEMPFLGTTIIHDEGVDLIVEYLNNL